MGQNLFQTIGEMIWTDRSPTGRVIIILVVVLIVGILFKLC